MKPLEKKSAVAIGFFDGIHLGHRQVINKALSYKNKGYTTCVFSFTTSEYAPTDGKAKNKILNLEQKVKICEEMGVDYLIIPDFLEFKDINAFDFVKEILKEKLNADFVCCGYDFRYGKNATGNTSSLQEDGKNLGIHVEIIDAILLENEPVSSTRIRKALKSGEIGLANRMLGRPYSYKTEVVHGLKLGRELGFPTINQMFKKNYAIPKFGVYASVVIVDDEIYPAVTNIGVKPTVGSDVPLSETYIIGLNQDLYEKKLEVKLIEYIREEEHFDSLDILKKQIENDAEVSEKIGREYIQNKNRDSSLV